MEDKVVERRRQLSRTPPVCSGPYIYPLRGSDYDACALSWVRRVTRSWTRRFGSRE